MGDDGLRGGGRRGVGRLEAFSDAVCAIAITLLVLGIDVPNVSDEDLSTALSALLPSVLAYFLGFAVIGLFESRKKVAVSQ